MEDQDKIDYQDYLDYQEYQQHLAKNPQVSAAQLATPPSGFHGENTAQRGAATDALSNALMGGYRPEAVGGLAKVQGQDYTKARDAESQRLAASSQQYPGTSAAMSVVGGIPAMTAATGKLGMVAGSAAYSALQNPGSDQGRVDPLQAKDRASNAVLGAVTGLLTRGAESGARKAADVLQQKAMGVARPMAGLGNAAVDEGIVGSKDMMKDQVQTKLKDAGQAIQSAASNISKPIDSAGIADDVATRLKKFITEGGQWAKQDEPAIVDTLAHARDVASRGEIPATEAAQFRAVAGRRANQAGAYKQVPGQSDIADLNKAEQGGYSDALKQAYADSNPGQPNAMAAADTRYGNLAKMRSGLNKPDDLRSLLLGAGKAAVGGGLGYQIDGAPGAIAGAAMSTPMGRSVGAKILQQGVGAAAKPAGQAALEELLRGQRGR